MFFRLWLLFPEKWEDIFFHDDGHFIEQTMWIAQMGQFFVQQISY